MDTTAAVLPDALTLSVAETAGLLGVSSKTVRKACAEGQLATCRIGGRERIVRQSVEQLVALNPRLPCFDAV